MKRVNNLFKWIISFDNLLAASRKARKGKRYRASTARFELDLEKNIFRIIDTLRNKTYKPGPYFDFYIHDPKKRIISAAPYSDRVIHHALINVIEPVIGNSFIYDTYACIKDKGTHRAVQRYREFQRINRYVLKCDIRKYFLRIDHDLLFQMVEKKIKCPDTLWLVRKIIDSKECREESEYFPGDDLFTPIERKTGIPVGNLTSQFFANLYLNGFDHFIKEELRQRYYIRYCDDFVLFGNSKAKLNDARIMIIDYLAALRLKLHENKSRVYRTAEGVDFLGYRIFPDHMAVRKSNVKKFRRKIVRLASDYRENRADLKTINASIQSWIGHVKHADSYRLREEVFSKAVFQRQQV